MRHVRLSIRLGLSALVMGAVFTPSPVFAAGDGGPFPFMPWSLLWALISFALVAIVLLKGVFPKITAAMDERTRAIREGLEAADKAREEAKAMMAQHQADLDKARAEGAAIVEEAKSDALKLKDSIVSDARTQAAEETQRALREIEQAKHTAVDALHRQASEISVDIASRLIKQQLSADDHKELIAERLKTFNFDN